jgi:hypothetical protein
MPGRWAMLPLPGQRLPAFTGRAKSGSCTGRRSLGRNSESGRESSLISLASLQHLRTELGENQTFGEWQGCAALYKFVRCS